MKNILGEEIKYDILIRTKLKNVRHKFAENFKPEEFSLCYWIVGQPPKREGIGSVLFTDGVTVFAEGNYFGICTEADGKRGIEFFDLKRVSFPQPKKAPLRGYTYVDVDRMERGE